MRRAMRIPPMAIGGYLYLLYWPTDECKTTKNETTRNFRVSVFIFFSLNALQRSPNGYLNRSSEFHKKFQIHTSPFFQNNDANDMSQCSKSTIGNQRRFCFTLLAVIWDYWGSKPASKYGRTRQWDATIMDML
jgi:hypothetical protein